MDKINFTISQCVRKIKGEVCISLQLHNSGENDIYFSSDQLFLDGITSSHKFKILDGPPAKCKFYEINYEPTQVLLKAHTTITSKINLANHCDFSPGGKHTIQFGGLALFCADNKYNGCTSPQWLSGEVKIELPMYEWPF